MAMNIILLTVRTTKDEQSIKVPLNTLKKFYCVAKFLEVIDIDNITEIPLHVDLETMQWIVKWGNDENFAASIQNIEWNLFVKLIKAVDFLEFHQLIRFIGSKILMDKIESCACETRLWLSFERSEYEYKEDDWEYVPVIDMDESNYLMHHISVRTVADLAEPFSLSKTQYFRNTFGKNTRHFDALNIVVMRKAEEDFIKRQNMN